jgi:hypothetical protein
VDEAIKGAGIGATNNRRHSLAPAL